LRTGVGVGVRLADGVPGRTVVSRATDVYARGMERRD
jgi:hypothetical protein